MGCVAPFPVQMVFVQPVANLFTLSTTDAITALLKLVLDQLRLSLRSSDIKGVRI